GEEEGGEQGGTGAGNVATEAETQAFPLQMDEEEEEEEADPDTCMDGTEILEEGDCSLLRESDAGASYVAGDPTAANLSPGPVTPCLQAGAGGASSPAEKGTEATKSSDRVRGGTFSGGGAGSSSSS
ncbi:unnamed protein product, partial [Laminaria digitata]